MKKIKKREKKNKDNGKKSLSAPRSSSSKEPYITKNTPSDSLKDQAAKFDFLVQKMLKSKDEVEDKLLIFSYDKGFVYSDLAGLSKYSITLR